MEIKLMTAALLVAALWAVICRINHMKHRVTKDSVFLQHSALAAGLLGALILPAEYAMLALASGVTVFLLVGAARWKDGAPKGINRPSPLNPLQFQKISGGKEQ